MPRLFTSGELIRSVERRGTFAVNRSTATPTQLLAYADEETLDTILPVLRKPRRGYYHEYADQTTTTETAYYIPSESAGMTLRNVALLDANGDPYRLEPVDFDAEIDLGTWWATLQRRYAGERLLGYYVHGDQVHLWPRSEAGKTLRLYFERLPNKLVMSETMSVGGTSYTQAAAKVVSVHASNGEVTCETGTVPAAWDTGTVLCVVKGTPGHTLRVKSSTAVTATTTVVDFPPDDVTGIVQPGDWIAELGDSPLVQLPAEGFSMLAQAVAVRWLLGVGSQKLPAAQQKLDETIKNFLESFPQRVDDAPKEIVSAHRLADSVLGY